MIRYLRSTAAALALFTSLPCAHAAVLYEQALPGSQSATTPWQWSNGWCSPCVFPDPNRVDRAFASFSLDAESLLLGGSFAVLDSTIVNEANRDISVSIWDQPFGTELFSASFATSGYTRTGTAGQHFAVVELPGWTLGPGSYWISLFGINGNSLSWGSDGRSGDDHSYRNGVLGNSQRYVGFSLYGESPVSEVPLPGTLGLLGLGLAGLLGFGRRARDA